MLNRTLARRLQQLETRLGAASQQLEFVVSFVDSDRAVVSKLTLKDGVQQWWYAPGHEPDGEQNEGPMPPENVQMAAEGVR